ncbi:aquaporin [Mycoplasmopsis verecunda]|uniref:Glycerol uptake facilitator (Major Intrinsic Protein Family) n=1 Tax=Mycoplasmopsis verecunda TaxID=171291 RepID=A0A1T4M6F5_9BACT|nr:aquaporin [Mycoplasmopsis verecunda]WPB54505.1 aquaporin [Mycoplasmopsis verecunda]SJZ62485.1 Glycerol uptake facilitator (Major Intrinsic Protein Family) [Mycoplasmopsis verecunda]
MVKFKMDNGKLINNTNIKQDKAQSRVKAFFNELFSFFKFKPLERMNAEKPSDLRTWLVHGISEFFGTILISLGLAGLSIYTKSGYVAETYLLHPIIVGFYAGFIVVGTCLFLFLRWSCDLNPAVTIYRYLNGRNNGWYATYKIIIQMLGAIAAGAIIYGLGKVSAKDGLISNAPITAISAANKSFIDYSNYSRGGFLAAGSTWIFFVELVMTSILLFPIFSPNINNKYRDLLIMFVISLSVWMGILGGSAAINPARGLAQQFPVLLFEGHSDLFIQTTGKGIEKFSNLGFTDEQLHLVKIKDYLNAKGQLTPEGVKLIRENGILWDSITYGTLAMVIGDVMSPVFYLFVQGATQKMVNPLVTKIISFKNYRAQSITTPEKENKAKGKK